MDLLNKGISQLTEMLSKGEISSEELTRKYIEQIEEKDIKLKAYSEITKGLAIRKAREIDEKRKRGEKLGVLAGIPMAITDDISTKDILTTVGSKMLKNYIPPFNATVVERLLKEDAIILGKLKVEEFGTTTFNSTVVVGKNEAVFSLGTDAGGSTREAALYNGVLSMKPTYGMVSRYGAMGNTSTFDQIGPITKNTKDMATILNIIVGYDKRDSTSIKKEKIDYTKALTKDIKGMKIGLLKEAVEENKEMAEEVIGQLRELGAIVEEISISSLEHVLPTYYIIACAEIASNAAKYDGIRYGYRTKEYENMEELYKNTRSEGFGIELKKQIMFGNFVVSEKQYEEYYKKAQRVRTLIKEELNEIFKAYDLIISPIILTKDEYKLEPYNLLANISGLPAMAIPYNKDKKGNSRGLSLMAPAYREDNLLKISNIYEDINKEINKVGGEA